MVPIKFSRVRLAFLFFLIVGLSIVSLHACGKTDGNIVLPASVKGGTS